MKEEPMMKVRLAMLLTLIMLAALGAPTLVSAINNPMEGLGVVQFNGVNPESASILVSPNHQNISLAVFTTGLAVNTNHTVEVFRNDICQAAGVSLTGPIGPVATDGLGSLNILDAVSLLAPIDQPGRQNIALRVFDNAGALVRCGNVFTTNPGGAGRHWW
jgi:hypothetical protein